MNEIFVVGYGQGYQSTYLATNNLKVPFFLPTVYDDSFEFSVGPFGMLRDKRGHQYVK